MCFAVSSGATLTITSTAFAEEMVKSSYAYTNSSDIELLYDLDGFQQNVAIWFPSVALPPSAYITGAYIQFMNSEAVIAGQTNTKVTVRISAERAVKPSIIREGYYNVTDRWDTNSYVDWNIPVWVGENDTNVEERTPSLVSILNELVTQNDWRSGNNIVIMISRAPNDTGNGTRISVSGKQGYGAPRMVITYQTGTTLKWVNASMTGYSEEVNKTKIPYLSTSEFQLPYDLIAGEQFVAVRFDNIFLPRNATIARAFVQFKCSTPSFKPIHLRVALEDSFFPDKFYNLAGDVSNRTLTQYLDWYPPSWVTQNDTTMAQQTPDLGQILQSYVSNDGGWSMGSSIVMVVSRDVLDRVTGNFNHSRYAWPLNETVTLKIAYTGGELVGDETFIQFSQTAEEAPALTNSVAVNQSTLCLPYDPWGPQEQVVGIRFKNIPIPQYATILSAFIQFRSYRVDDSSLVLRVYGDRTQGVGSYAFAETTANVTGRNTTLKFADWTLDAWGSVGDAFPEERTPDLSPILQELVSQPSWSKGNSISLIFLRSPNDDYTSINTRVAVTGVTGGGGDPFLVIRFNSTANLANKPDPSLMFVRSSEYAEQVETTGSTSLTSSGVAI